MLQRIEIHNTPKDAAGSTWWGSDRRPVASAWTAGLADWKSVVYEINAWKNRRNAARARIKRQFTTEKAHNKLALHIPTHPESQITVTTY